MRRRVPCWTGLFFSVISLAGLGLPFLELEGRTWSLFQIYCEAGLPLLAWGSLGLLAALPLTALWGWRRLLLAGGAAFAWSLGRTVAAIAAGAGAEPLLRHLAAGAWWALAGSAGLLLSVFLRRLDRRIFSGLLTGWRLPPQFSAGSEKCQPMSS